jgi:hypothetical protein
MDEQPQRRRRSFDEVLQDSLAQWSKRFERALEEQRQVIGNEAQQRSSEIARLTLEQLDALEQVAGEKIAELEQIAVDYREGNERVLTEKSAEVELATRRQVDASVNEVATAFDKFAGKRLDELEDTLRTRIEAFRRDLIDETHSARDATAEQLNETRSLVTSETRQLEEQAVASQDEMRRVAAKESASFDELARERISELRDLLSNQTELLAEFASTHEATNRKLEEARGFTRDTMARLSKLNDEVAGHIRENNESAAAAARVLKQASATELNSIQQRAMALRELAAKLTADIERRAEGLLEAESSTAEGLHEFEQQLEGRRAEIESLVEEQIGGAADQVRQAEAGAVRRISELGGRAEATLGEEKRQLETTRTAMQKEFREIRRADGSAIQAIDARMSKLVEMLAATQVTLEELADRVEELETFAGAPSASIPRSRAPALDAPALDAPSLDEPAVDGLAVDEPAVEARPSRTPRPDPASTPDLREW